ncbi:hypothetical protein SAMN04488096_101243 [Mesonia phycicola]|uniref:CarboxypepD_reg-like domain-containing protein n=1 Tax=Mesonia phycicola TaxID=579105 RepID=A0A1M6AF85_9FLAO|nr:hypothetical protein [Mesonia phycicola]SHI35190.1 hypothetical protein SAMN04488096_101243 [Mesonia phycicola]
MEIVKPKYLSILIFFTTAVALSQQYRGKIIADSIAFSQVNIVNLTQETGTINNTKGEFVIDAIVGDEIVFSSLQYEPYQVTITEETLQQSTNIIYLFPEVNELEEVNISNIDLTGDLLKDVTNIEVDAYFNPLDYDLPVNTKPKPTTAQRRLYTAKTGNGIVPLDPIINAMTGRLAMLERQRDYEKETNLMIKGYNSRPLDYFITDLGIPEDLVEDFLYYCTEFKPFRSLLVKSENTFKLSTFYEEKSESYKKIKKLP